MDAFANAAAFDASAVEASRGMQMPRAYQVQPGQVLYRFVDLTRSPVPAVAADGPWWFEYEAFQQIRHFGLRHGHSASYAARLHAAILYEWSDVNAYVRAEVLQPLRVWKGRGRQVRSSGRDRRDTPAMTPMQGMHEVYQLYIPGLGRDSALVQSAFKILGCFPLGKS